MIELYLHHKIKQGLSKAAQQKKPVSEFKVKILILSEIRKMISSLRALTKRAYSVTKAIPFNYANG